MHSDDLELFAECTCCKSENSKYIARDQILKVLFCLYISRICMILQDNQNTADVCRNLHCNTTTSSCGTYVAAHGTPCGNNLVCTWLIFVYSFVNEGKIIHLQGRLSMVMEEKISSVGLFPLETTHERKNLLLLRYLIRGGSQILWRTLLVFKSYFQTMVIFKTFTCKKKN